MSAFTVHRSAEALDLPVSTGCPAGNLITAESSTSVYVAAGNSVKHVTLAYGGGGDENIEFDFESGVGVRNPYHSVTVTNMKNHTHTNVKGDGNNIISIDSHILSPTSDGYGNGGNVIIGSVDGYGHAYLSRPLCDKGDAESSVVTHLQPSYDSVRKEYGWSGITFNPADSSEVTTAMQQQRLINIYNDGKSTREIYTELPIHAITYTSPDTTPSHQPLIAVTERHQISVWDPRMMEKGGCIRRMMPGSGVLHTVTSGKGMLCAGGVDRVAFFIDPRKWRTVGSWRGGLKFDINKIYLSNTHSNTAYAFGRIDGEFATGSWEAGGKNSVSRLTKKNFLADSRWIGVGKVPGDDAFVGLVSSRHLFTLSHCEHLASKNLKNKHKLSASPPAIEQPPHKKARTDTTD
eukprot:CFRG6304T1